MIRQTIALALFSAAAYGQLELVIFDGSAERPLTAVTDLGSTAMGDASETRFRTKNPGPGAIALQSITVAGTAFSLSSKPVLPYVIAPGNFAEFRLRFAPVATGSYSAALAVNGSTVLVRATAVSAPVLSVDYGAIATVVSAGASIDFGRVLKNRSATLGVRLANAASVDITVSSLLVSGAAFHVAGGVALPLRLRPGDAVSLRLSFDPKSSGAQTGTLSVDDRQFTLTGIGYDPPIPPPSITVTGVTLSASQPKVAVKLADVSETAGTGVLMLDFQPLSPATPDDPAIVFLATGSRKMSFTVSEGDSAATFGSQKEVTIQTGTTAGTLTLTLQLSDYQVRQAISIAPAVVSVDSARTARRVSDLDVTLTGFDNTRSAGKFNFTFYDASGRAIQPGAIAVDASSDFARYFAISRVGGAFLMRATFPVTGDATQIAGVEVELVNSAGIVKTARVAF